MSNPIGRDGDTPPSHPVRELRPVEPDTEHTDRQAVLAVFGDAAPDPDAVTNAAAVARRAIAVQGDPALLDARTPEELREEIAQARRHRSDLLKQADKDHQDAMSVRDHTRSSRVQTAKNQADHEAKLAGRAQKWEAQKATAAETRDRLLDSESDLVTARRVMWLPWAAMMPAGIAVIVSAVNLATQGVRILDAPAFIGGGLGGGLDLVFSAGLAVLLLGRVFGAIHRGSTASRAYLMGELVLGGGIAAASVIAHHLPSADGTAHTAELGWWFLLLPVAFGFSTIFAPLLARDTREQFRTVAEKARQQAALDQISAPTKLFGSDQAAFFRMLRWISEEDAAGRIPGQRDEDGLPSATGVMKHVRDEFGEAGGRFSKPNAGELLHAYAVLNGPRRDL